MKQIKVYGMELPVFIFFTAIICICIVCGIVPTQMVGEIAVLFLIGIILGEVGDHLPIWNSYCGGGAMLAFIGAGLLKYFDVLPECVTANADGWINGYSFLNVFIAFLIVGSLIGMDRKVLIKSGSLFIPTILASVAGAAILGILGGLVFGKTPVEMLTAYVFPIMGGGAGAGAIPMAQVYSDVTGTDSASYLSFALAILALGNIVAILMAVVLDLIGRSFPKLTGGDELLRSGKQIEQEAEKKEQIKADDIAAGIYITAGFFMLGQLMASKILPSIFGVSIPSFAYMILFAALANIFGLIPDHLRHGVTQCQKFCAGKLVWIQMAGMGIAAIDFHTMLSVLSLSNLVIVILIVAGAVLGSALFGWIVGFYPIESGITAGLCMANMGGAGDLAVLGAAKRMGLMGYAQISSRIGGAIILLIASVAFSFVK
ncbi:MAG: damage-inducible protein CinA [Coprococcus comes]|nr:damage-inducible protein CinA [Coprococcus comes]